MFSKTLTFSDIVLFLTCATHIFLAIFVFFQAKKKLINRVFALFILSAAGWVLSNTLIDLSTNIVGALIWGRSTAITTSLLAVNLAHFSLIFPQESKYRISAVKIIWLAGAVFTFLSFTPLIVAGVDINIYPVRVLHGPLYYFLIIFIVSLIIYSFINFRKSYLQVERLEKVKFNYFLFGLLGSVITALSFNVVFPVAGITNLVRLGPTSTLLLGLSTTYSIIRFRFLDIKVALRALAVKLISVIILTLIFLGTYYVFRLFIVQMTMQVGVGLIITLAFISAFFYRPLLSFIRNSTDAVLFQREYSREELLKELGKTVSESIDLTILIENIKDVLLQVMHMKFVAFVFFPEERIGLSKFEVESFGPFNKKYAFQSDNFLVSTLNQTSEVLVRDELKRRAEDIESPAKKNMETIVTEMDKIGAQVLVPLPASKGLVGMLALGEKGSGDAYTTTDIQTLETLMYQAGTAIENARLYNEVKSFSQKLQQEVKVATTDLVDKNKFLNTLRRLDQIIMNTLDLSSMCQKIVDTVSWEMGYAGGLIGLLDKKNNLIRTQALSDAPIFQKVKSLLPKDLRDLAISLNDEHHVLVQLLKDGEMKVVPRMAALFTPAISYDLAEKIQGLTKIKTNLVYALSAKGKELGIIIIGLTKDYAEVSERERELIQAFVEQAGIAVENATLYSELEQINKELNQANEHLKELDKMKDEFVSIASHELRTPMTAIKGYLWMLDSGKHKLKMGRRHAEYLERVKASTERLINLVNDMLDVSRIEGGRMQLNIKNGVAEHMISGVLAEIMPKALEKKIDLIFERPKSPLPKVRIDENRIREVLMNLLGNALKFTPENGKITVSARKQGKMVNISVVDTGKGIARNDIPKLFQKFGRLEHSFALISETSGTGLGLYITKSLVGLHGGKIWVKSTPGKGSTFTFSLRVVEE